MRFNLKRMCANCPFRDDDKAIPLQRGRLSGIVESLQDDYNTFPCHKTTHGAAKEESACIGAAAYMWSVHGRLSVLSRLAIMVGSLSRGTLEKVSQHTIKTRNPEHEQ